VTGAAGGVGLEIARELARRGLIVHVSDVDGDAAARAAEEVGGRAFALTLDVRDAEACRAAARATAERAGSLAVWVNNAAVLWAGWAWEQDAASRQAVFEVNALGTINGTLAALELMRPAGSGHVLNVVSLAGLVAVPGEVLYGATKHAALAFSLGTLLDLRRAGERSVHVSCLCPDGIWTPMISERLDDPHAAVTFSGTMLTPRQVAERAGGLLDRPRPVATIPRRRAALARTYDLFPRLERASMKPLLAVGRLKARRLRRKIEAGGWPPLS
jgi:NAD(P)-dependent dehydrogenase (short-subunit alcohol dehydrogenase family)